MKKLISLFLMIIFIFNGCVTKTLWGERENKVEEVNIKEFLYSKEKKLIVFLAEKYHFIFDGDVIDSIKYDLMMSMLSLKKDKRAGMSINEDLSVIHMLNSNDISCQIHIDLDPKLVDEEQIELYKKLGFIDYYDPSNKNMLSIILQIKGKIYKAKKTFKKYSQTLNKLYKINMFMKVNNDSDIKRYGKMALTPLTLVADTALTVAGVGAGIGITALGIATANPDGMRAGFEVGFRVMFGTIELQGESLMEFLDKVEKVDIK